MRNIQNQLFIVTILFFVLSLIHISLALLGLGCFIIPFIQYARYKDKVWCKYYCPRAGFLNRVISKINMGRPAPKWLTGKRIKKGVVIYFSLNLFFVFMSTLMVSLGRVAPIDQVRFLIAFSLPGTLPQVMDWMLPNPLLHFSYRIFSMMFTSTVIGSILGILYKPRTWCAVCPVSTLTTSK